MACTTPPPFSPAGTGILVKKSRLMLPGALEDQVEQDEEERQQRDHDGAGP